MVTYEQAINEHNFQFHEGECKKIVGPRGGVKFFVKTWRRNGRTKVWKTRPGEFTIPVKYGFRTCGYITHMNSYKFHIDLNCPLVKLGTIDSLTDDVI